MPPFILREYGLVVNDVPQIHVNELTWESHSILDEESGLRIRLKLDGVVSYFPTIYINKDELEDPGSYEAIFLSPDAESWDPYDEPYALNEDSFIDNKVGMIYPTPTQTHELIAEADVDTMAVEESTSEVHKKINEAIDAVIASLAVASSMLANPQEGESKVKDKLSLKTDTICAQVADVSGTLDPNIFNDIVLNGLAQAKYSEAVVLTSNPQYPDCELFIKEEALKALTSATHAEKPNGATAEILEKVWRIDCQNFKRTIRTNTQLSHQYANSILSGNFGTND